MNAIRREWRRFVDRCVWSLAGWRSAWASEPSLKFWTTIVVVSSGLALVLPLNFGERMVILPLGLLVLAAELMNMMAGVETTHVPYKGGSAAITDLIGGHVDFSFGSPIIVLPQIEAGNLKALAVTGPNRMEQLPDVPTMAEAGLEGYKVSIWYGVLAPAGTPKDVIEKLSAEIQDIVTRDDVKERLNAAGMRVYSVPPDEFKVVMEEDMAMFGEIIKKANVSLE